MRCQIVGIDDMRKALLQLGDVARKQVVRAALTKSLAPVAAEAARRAPTGTDDAGALVAKLVMKQLRGARKELRARAKKELALRDSIIVTTQLSPSQQRRRVREPAEFEAFVSSVAPHAHLVEFGHRLVKVRRVGKTLRKDRRSGRYRERDVIVSRVVGHVPPHPFLRPAFDAQREAVVDRFGVEVGRALERTANRLFRQAQAGTLSKAGAAALRLTR